MIALVGVFDLIDCQTCAVRFGEGFSDIAQLWSGAHVGYVVWQPSFQSRPGYTAPYEFQSFDNEYPQSKLGEYQVYHPALSCPDAGV